MSDHVGLIEEGLVRGTRFRFLEEGLGSWAALVLTPKADEVLILEP